MTPRILRPRIVRPDAVDLVRAVVPPARPLPARSPLPAYDPHDPELEPQTDRMWVPPERGPRLGPGDEGCRYCWCARMHHTRGYGDAVGPCKRLGCDTDCPGYRRAWTAKRIRRAVAVGLAVAIVGGGLVVWAVVFIGAIA